MKFILLSDIHYTSKIPRSRKDNVLLTGKIKLDYVFRYAKRINASIIHAGDLFNSPRDINALFSFLSIIYKYPEVKFYTIWGQHDQYGRNNKVPTNLGILKKARLVKILSNNPVRIDDCLLYGCSWNKKIPIIEKNKLINILSIHAPISIKGLWKEHKYILAKKVSKNFDLIVCGDIHLDFIYKRRNKIVCNTGPLMRLEATKYNLKHTPIFYIYNTKNKSLKTEYIPCKNASEVIGIKHIKVKENNELSIIDQYDFDINKDKIDVMKIIEKLVLKSNNSEDIKDVISEISSEIDYEK